MKKGFLLVFLSSLLMTPVQVIAQASRVYPDAGLWSTITLEKKINKKFSVSIDEELRLKENYSRLNLFYTNLGLNYKLSKKIRLALIYRFTQKKDDELDWSYKHRLMIDITYREKLSKKLLFQYRHRFQFENRDIYSTPDGRYMESFMRSKFELGYMINKKLKPYISEELRFQLVDPRNAESNFGFHRMRTAVGVDYNFDSNHSAGIYYLVQNEFNVFKPNDLFITGIQYAFQF